MTITMFPDAGPPFEEESSSLCPRCGKCSRCGAGLKAEDYDELQEIIEKLLKQSI